MRVWTEQGKRQDNDRIVFVESYRSGEKIKFKDLLHILQLFFENEDRLYPPPAKGRYFLFDAITDVVNGEDFNVVADRYLLPKSIKSARKLIEEKKDGNGGLVEKDKKLSEMW